MSPLRRLRGRSWYDRLGHGWFANGVVTIAGGPASGMRIAG